MPRASLEVVSPLDTGRLEWGRASRAQGGLCVSCVSCPLPPHPRPRALPFLPPAAPICPLHSPEEIKVDGGELVLDEGPECPDEVRRLDTDQRGQHGTPPATEPTHLEGRSHSWRTQSRDTGRDMGPPWQIVEVRSLGSIWGLHTLQAKVSRGGGRSGRNMSADVGISSPGSGTKHSTALPVARGTPRAQVTPGPRSQGAVRPVASGKQQ